MKMDERSKSKRADSVEKSTEKNLRRKGPTPKLRKDYQRPSHELLYECMMRGGGEPFGKPFEASTSTLTQKVVRFFKQKGFFSFETVEKPRVIDRKNKFTRYGAAPNKKPLRSKDS